MSELFDATGQERISEAVRAAEVGTTGELVPVVTTRCDSYAEGRYRGALLGAGLMTFLAPLVPYALPIFAFVALQLVGFGIGFWIAGWDPIERALIGKKTLLTAAQARAERAFFEYGIEKTRGATGVLLFVSLFEHAVIVLGDKGVSAKVEPSAWQKVTSLFGERMRQQGALVALCDAIGATGELLRAALPSAPGAENPNELPDSLRHSPTTR